MGQIVRKLPLVSEIERTCFLAWLPNGLKFQAGAPNFSATRQDCFLATPTEVWSYWPKHQSMNGRNQRQTQMFSGKA